MPNCQGILATSDKRLKAIDLVEQSMATAKRLSEHDFAAYHPLGVFFPHVPTLKLYGEIRLAKEYIILAAVVGAFVHLGLQRGPLKEMENE